MNGNNLETPVLVISDAGIYACGDRLKLRLHGAMFVIRPRGSFYEFLLRLCDVVDAATAATVSEAEMSVMCRACEQGLDGSLVSWRVMPTKAHGISIQVFDQSPATASRSGGRKMSWWIADLPGLELDAGQCEALSENLRRWLSARVLAGVGC